MEKGKFRGLARNFTAHGKLCVLHISYFASSQANTAMD